MAKYKEYALSKDELTTMLHGVLDILIENTNFDNDEEKSEFISSTKIEIERFVNDPENVKLDRDLERVIRDLSYEYNEYKEGYYIIYEYEFEINEVKYGYMGSAYIKDHCICETEYDMSFSKLVEKPKETKKEKYTRKLEKAKEKVEFYQKELEKLN